MKVLVDTCVWSFALRRKKPDNDTAEKLREIIRDGRLAIIGSIRQEILSGISSEAQFVSLKEYLSPFEDIVLHSHHFIKAAEFCNTCMKQGIQGSTIDFLICAAASMERLKIFTADKDFSRYAKHLPIELF